MIASAVEIRDGLFFMLGGDWERFGAPNIPFDAIWPVICTARWEPRQWTVPRGLFLSALRPDGREASRLPLVIPTTVGAEGCYRWVYQLGFKLDIEGVWTLKVHSGSFLLAQIEVRVTVAPSPSA